MLAVLSFKHQACHLPTVIEWGRRGLTRAGHGRKIMSVGISLKQKVYPIYIGVNPPLGIK